MKKNFPTQDNLIPLWFSIFSFSLAFVIFLSLNVHGQETSDFHKISGYWEGEFMPGNHLTMILHFQESEDGATVGRIFLYQENNQIQDDALSDIQFDGKQLKFLIEAKNTPFRGALSEDGNAISGEFQFPDNSFQPVQVRKVEKPSKGYLAGKEVGADALDRKYSVTELQNDFNFLRKQLEQTHPQLYLYTSKKEFDRLFVQTYANIQNEMTEDEFFRLIAPVVEKVHCVHTGIRPSEAYEKMITDSPGFLPLDIRFVKGKAYVINDYSQSSSVEKGMQVLSINGRTVEDIYKRLMDCIPSDGYNQTAKTFEVNADFSRVYVRYIGKTRSYELKCVRSSGEKVRLSVRALTGKELEEAMRAVYLERFPAGLPVNLKTDEKKSTVILTVSGFWARNPDDYIAFLEKAFAEMKSKNVQHLIIDVRGNKGGHPFFGAELLSYLAKSDFIYFEQPEERPEIAPLYHPWPVKENAFKGDIYVLMDGGCLSTTGHFLSLLRYHKLGTLIGEESGGSFYCNDGSKQLTLPETGIRFNLPQVTFQTAVSGFRKGEPLLPDYSVTPGLDDLLEGKDAVMEYTMKLIKD
ncbi:S41 family peptidase [Prolixibacter denitrificans]|uniref:Peptidase S41-like protein n=1 Tax=Prolixibacter denitrificans TaxID=1541063 RepID=A0A2P8CDP9_9BACT|nr:S41 family peptidase [Prolixibacter denitrificans]PSK83118.1 peptidase S41-like protein [Prolixibacter denitrificans]GET21999.1 hypothetical protein JCM18694_22450 [Prolixibacter denitrificans]